MPLAASCELKTATGRAICLGMFGQPMILKKSFRKRSLSGYLGLLYIDVDRLGRHLHDHAPNQKQYSSLSNTIKDAVNESVEDILAGMLVFTEERAGRQVQQAYYEILLLGGDDAIVRYPRNIALSSCGNFSAAIAKLSWMPACRPLPSRLAWSSLTITSLIA